MQARKLSEPIIVGRDNELTQLGTFLDSAISGKGTTVFISGEAGTGKTRLVNEFLNNTKKNNVTILSGWCLSNAAIPYFPFIEAFESLQTGNDEGNSFTTQQLSFKTWLTEPTLSEQRENNYFVNLQLWKDQTFAAVTKQLLQLSTSKPVILFIDDVHWADSASLSLIHYISRYVSSERILVVSTFRSEEIQIAIDDHPNQLSQTLRLMGREGIFKQIKLANLSQNEVDLIAKSMLGEKPTTQLTEKLASESRGNPLFIVESLRMLHEEGNLILKDGQWHLSIETIGIPAMVKDVIGRRLDSLKPTQKRVLNAASILGERFAPDLVSEVISLENLDVLEALNDMELSGGLVISEQDCYRFDHPKIREMVYEKIPPLMKKAFHLKIAQKMENPSIVERKFSLSEIAFHYVQAGNTEKAITSSLVAGKDALLKFSNAEAIKHFKYVLEKLPNNLEYNEQRAAALEGLGDAIYANMGFKEAAKTYLILSEIEGINKLRTLRKTMEAAFFQNDVPLLIKLIDEAEKCSDISPLDKAWIKMNRGRAFLMQGQFADSAKCQEQALRIFEEEYSLWDCAWVLIALGVNQAFIGKLEEALSSALRAIKLFEELGDPRWLLEAYNMAGLTLGVNFGFWDEALSMLEKAEKTNNEKKLGDYLRLAQINVERSWFYSSMRDSKNASEAALLGVEYAEKTDSDWAKGMAYANLSNGCIISNNMDKAQEYFEKLSNLPAEVRLNPNVNWQLANAMMLAGRKQWEECIQSFEQIIHYLKASSNQGMEAITKSCYVWALFKQRKLLKAGAQMREIQKFYKGIRKRFANANIHVNTMASTKIEIQQKVEARIDIVNVSNAAATLLRADNIVPFDFSIESTTPKSIIINESIEFGKQILNPLTIKTIKIKLNPKKTGIYHFAPTIVYQDDKGETKNFQTKALRIEVTSSQSRATETNSTLENKPVHIDLRSENARKIFDFLLASFKEDYVKHRLSIERSGWRTLMDIVNEGKVSKYSVYGSMGARGHALLELDHSGLVETRLFAGERGRGGEVLKVRIAYDRELVRKLIVL